MAVLCSCFTFFAQFLSFSLFVCIAASLNTSQPFPAFFIFGDSLVDVGNNNYITTFARADGLPYGIDFPQGPTGRFCNGKLVVDFISELLSLPLPSPYLSPTTKGNALLQGVNYASAGSGILQSSGYNAIGRIGFDTQIQWFTNTIKELQQLIGISATETLVAQSLFSTTFGANDYLNNYLFPTSPVARYSPPEYQQILLDKVSSHLTQLYNLGVRNITVSNIGAIGCTPHQTSRNSVNGECVERPNSLVSNYNEGLNALVDALNSKLSGANFVYIDNFRRILAYSTEPNNYGLTDGLTACCGVGRFNGQSLKCLPLKKPCTDRAGHLWWDSFHPTEAANQLLAMDLYQSLKYRFL